VTRALRTAIVTEQLKPGERLAEESLGKELDVSRGPVREALRQLEIEGLIEPALRRGYVVVGISDADIDEIFSLRGAIEPLALSLSMQQVQPDSVQQLEHLIDDMLEAGRAHDPARFAAADVAFHSHFYVMAGHRRLRSAWEHLAPQVTLLLEVSNAIDRDLEAAALAHQSLLEAFEAQDVDRLMSALVFHLSNSRQLIIRGRVSGQAVKAWMRVARGQTTKE
jgi:GntR family transcriptional regulator of gluconate operon